jgi:two-component system LytT family response regulator
MMMATAGMLPIRTVIVDDEPPARTRLRSLLEEDPEIEIVAECDDGARAIAAIQQLKPALVFLDIEMPDGNGLEVLNSLHWLPVTIFVTAYRDYAVSAFEACALDYLLKPFTRSRFANVLARAKEQIARNAEHEIRKEDAPAHGAGRAPADLLILKAAGKLVFVRTSELRWIQAEKDYARLHLRRGSHFIRETMANLQNRLDPFVFVRIHRSTIVNINEISEVTPLPGSDCNVLLRDGTELTLSRRYRPALDRFWGREMVSKVEPSLPAGSHRDSPTQPVGRSRCV